ncbi:hypothetical protein CBR_g21318 [Chara braunii]|uniref:Uncharacterized protein n=1 Tax=Chara braunii TaxID=69332 RepID=A0A388L1F1_CHABU|nr:hypothetical protein CBR_g21318 [Chara braunii]|eukprot:GBG76078.1 hypothetical protein CBR_g21318 [Chara braunii]
MATLAEVQPEDYTHPMVDDEDEEDEPEPEEWGARAQSAMAAYEISAQVRRFQQQGGRHPGGVAEVFGARAEILLPYDHVPPPPAEPVEASEEQTDTEGGEDFPSGVDKSAERFYYTHGGGADGFWPRCTFIRESDDDSIPTTNIGLERGQRDASRAASGVGRCGTSGDALGGSSGVPRGGCREREVTRLDSADDEEPLWLRKARLAQHGASPATEGLRRSPRPQQTLARSTSGGRHEAPTNTQHPVPETSPQGDVDSGSAMGGDLGASEYGDPTVSNVVLGLSASGTLQRDPAATQEAVPMDNDSGELDGGRRPDEEVDDGAGDPDRLAPAHSAGLGRSSHCPIGGDACGPVQGDAHVDEAGGSMLLALVLRDPSPVAHEDPSHSAEGGGGVDEEGEGGTAHDRPDPVRADMEEGQITLGLLDPVELQRVLVEDPISRGPAGSLGVGVRSPPLYTPMSPLYFGSPTSLECEKQCSESSIAVAFGARTTRIPPVTSPPPTTLLGTPTTVTDSIVERGHMSSSSSPHLDTQQSLHRPWNIVRRVDDGVSGDFTAQQARLREEQRPTPSMQTAYRILRIA